MGILAIGEYIKHWKRNVFVVIQISVLLLVLCVSVTMLATIFRAYKPVQHMADKKGIYVTSFGYHGVNAKDIANGMKKIESVYSWGSTTLANQDENADMITAVYPEDVLNDYAPDLSEGKWLTDADDKKGVLPVVISENSYGWRTGSMLNFQQIDESGKTKNIKAEVVGVMEEGTNVIGHDFGQGQVLQNDYRDIYSTYRYEQKKGVLILTGEQKAKENGVTYTFNQDHFIVYQDDITKYEMSSNSHALKRTLGTGNDGSTIDSSLQEFMKNTKHHLQKESMMYLPVLICVLIITIISIVNVCALNMSDDLYHNAIFSLLGLPWRRCVSFSVIQSFFTAFFSVVMFFALFATVQKLNLTEYLLIKLDWVTVVSMVVMLVVLCFVHWIVPYVILCRKQPVEVFRDRKENKMISIKNLVKIYNKGKGNEYKALKGIDFQVQDEELVAVIGKSGAGKSTCCMFCRGISFESGSYYVGNQDVGQMSEKTWRVSETKVLEWLCKFCFDRRIYRGKIFWFRLFSVR